MKPPPSRSFTLVSNSGLFRDLVTPCLACAAFDPTKVSKKQLLAFQKFSAIWDTGATASVITKCVVDVCKLKPVGMKIVYGVHGQKSAETFLINVGLPNDVAVANVEVTLGDLAGTDMLIGMDIITAGDFSITNVKGRTIFSFRIPSLRAIDFVKESKGQHFRPGPPTKTKRRRKH